MDRKENKEWLIGYIKSLSWERFLYRESDLDDLVKVKQQRNLEASTFVLQAFATERKTKSRKFVNMWQVSQAALMLDERLKYIIGG